MFGRNPKRAAVQDNGYNLDVHEIFATMQGEGIFAGKSSVFIRLSGCNLACAFCDTEFEAFHPMTLEDIIGEVNRLSASMKEPLVVITGGEPLRQPIGALCDLLLSQGFMVQVETNGTLFRPLDKRVYIICSPKAVNTRYHPLRPDMLERCNALKFIVSATMPSYQQVPDYASALAGIKPVYIQPMDEYHPAKNAANLAYSIKLARKSGYMLSMQLHKILGVA